jgi:hypothetical protein
VQKYLDEWVYVKDRAEYWDKLGPRRMPRLRIASRMSEVVIMGSTESANQR